MAVVAIAVATPALVTETAHAAGSQHQSSTRATKPFGRFGKARASTAAHVFVDGDLKSVRELALDLPVGQRILVTSADPRRGDFFFATKWDEDGQLVRQPYFVT
jgi:hypothetical protein